MEVRATAITTKDTAVVSVPNAYSAGEVTLVVIAQISRGSVLRLPIGMSVRGNSSYESVNPNSATAMMPGRRIGSTTFESVCQGPAPRSRAASSYAGLKRLNTANMISSPNGSVQVSCAPSADEYQ